MMKTTNTTTAEAPATLDSYLKEIGREELLSRDQERELAKRIKQGDEKARRHFIKANLRLVVHVAKQYAQPADPESLMDLIQEGNLGLFRAVERYDPARKTRFSTYAVYWIRQAIQRHLAHRPLKRLPEHVVGQIRRLRRARSTLHQQLGRSPSAQELAREIGIETRDVHRLEEYAEQTVSLEQPVRGEEGDERELGDLLEDLDAARPELAASHHLLRSHIRGVVDELPGRERDIVRLRFGLHDGMPRTLEEIGQRYGVSRERVRQIQNEALDRLRRKHILVSPDECKNLTSSRSSE